MKTEEVYSFSLVSLLFCNRAEVFLHPKQPQSYKMDLEFWDFLEGKAKFPKTDLEIWVILDG